MLSDLIKQLQQIYQQHGDMPVVAGHLAEGVETSWEDEISYEYMEHFTHLSPFVTQIQTEYYRTPEGVECGIRSVDVSSILTERDSLSTDMLESLPHSLQKTLHHPQHQQVLCLYLDGKNLDSSPRS